MLLPNGNGLVSPYTIIAMNGAIKARVAILFAQRDQAWRPTTDIYIGARKTIKKPT